MRENGRNFVCWWCKLVFQIENTKHILSQFPATAELTFRQTNHSVWLSNVKHYQSYLILCMLFLDFSYHLWGILSSSCINNFSYSKFFNSQNLKFWDRSRNMNKHFKQINTKRKKLFSYVTHSRYFISCIFSLLLITFYVKTSVLVYKWYICNIYTNPSRILKTMHIQNISLFNFHLLYSIIVPPSFLLASTQTSVHLEYCLIPDNLNPRNEICIFKAYLYIFYLFKL